MQPRHVPDRFPCPESKRPQHSCPSFCKYFAPKSLLITPRPCPVTSEHSARRLRMPLVTRTFLLPRDRDRSREAKGQRQRRGPCRPLFGTAAAPVAKEPKQKKRSSAHVTSCSWLALQCRPWPKRDCKHLTSSSLSHLHTRSRSDDRVGRLRCGLDGRRFDQCKP